MQKRLLFVDDEEIMRELYSTLESVLGKGHEVCTAAGGKEALRLLSEKSFDVVVSDLAMPQMDGVEFLNEVVQRYPESARIVISGFADRLKVAECLTVGHRFLNKPFNFKGLTGLLKRIAQFSYLISNDRVRRIVCGNNALPTPPDIFLRLTEMLNSEYTEIEDIGRIVAQDAGLSTKLLHIVNSAQFGSGRQITSPGEAVQMIGVEILRALMLGMQVFNFYDESPFVKNIFKELWNHSLSTAVGARKLAVSEKLPTAESDQCFLAGLLHDIGKLILAANSEPEYRLVVDLATKSSVPLHQAEMGIYGSTHAQIGAYLLALWGVPDQVIRAVETHHSLEIKEEGFGPAIAVHAAQTLAPGTGREVNLDNEALEKAGLADRIPVWNEILAREN